MLRKNALLLGLIYFSLTSFGQIVKSGTISSNQTWSADTIKVTGNITINNGITLTINPGVFIEFQGYYSIDVKGRIVALGTETDSVKFDIIPDSIGRGWNGIIFNNTSTTNDTSKFEYCRISNSKREVKGGVFFIYYYSKVSFSNCLFSDNLIRNSNSYEGGGVIFIDHSNIKVHKCKFFNNGIASNHWGNRGGAIYSYYSSLVVENSIFYNNGSGSSVGGAIAFTKGSGRMVNCLFYSNSSSSGGGALYGDYGFNGKVINCTFVNNQSTVGGNFGGGAIYIFGNYGLCNINITNTILWQNTSNQIFIDDSKAVIQYSCVENPTNSIRTYDGGTLNYMENNLYVDPKFKDISTNNFNIESSSLLINAGIPDTTALGILKYDLNDSLRICNNRIDIGAYEYQQEPDPRIVISSDIPNSFIRYDHLFVESINVLSYPESYTYTFLINPDGMVVRNDSIIWTPTKGHASRSYNVSLKVANSLLSDTLNFTIHVLDDNEFAELENQDLVWDFDTVKVFSDLTVQNGNTLTIKPGTFIEFQGHYKLNIQGRILASGTADSIISFTAKDTILTNTSGGWNGIRFAKTPVSNDSSILVNCVFKYGNGLFGSTYGGALYFEKFNKILVLNCKIVNNKAVYGGGIYCNDASPLFINNLIVRNEGASGGAFGLSYGASPRIINNTIASNNSGISCFIASPIIKNTILWNKAGYEVYGYEPSASLSYCNTKGGLFSGEGNFSKDPLFVNISNLNYDISDASPCVNAGNPSWTTDSLITLFDLSGMID